jgi:hypothetical protein
MLLFCTTSPTSVKLYSSNVHFTNLCVHSNDLTYAIFPIQIVCIVCYTLFTLCSDNLFYFPKQLGFKMFLGVTATVTNWDAEGTSCSFVLEDNPLVDFVELPDTCHGLQYCNVLSGVIRGALEMVSFVLSELYLLLFTCHTFEYCSKLVLKRMQSTSLNYNHKYASNYLDLPP